MAAYWLTIIDNCIIGCGGQTRLMAVSATDFSLPAGIPNMLGQSFRVDSILASGGRSHQAPNFFV